MPEYVAAGRWLLETIAMLLVEYEAPRLSGIGYAFVFRKPDAQRPLRRVILP
jgi:hypothetical protein